MERWHAAPRRLLQPGITAMCAQWGLSSGPWQSLQRTVHSQGARITLPVPGQKGSSLSKGKRSPIQQHHLLKRIDNTNSKSTKHTRMLPTRQIIRRHAWSNDNDTDNDGVSDFHDAWPLDSAESVDTDDDGVGNNADTDDDGDGVADDSDDCL